MPQTNRPAVSERIDPAPRTLFRAARVEGAFVLLDLAQRVRTVVNPERADAGYLPASTFKIPHTLIGLETGVLPDERLRLRWDGTRYPIDSWNRDQDLGSAMKHSVVWYYQRIARRIGAVRMQRALDRFGYGNRKIRGGIDRFWLSGGLRITPRQQVDFLRRLAAGTLPVSPSSRAIVLRLLPHVSAEGVTVRAKTGLTQQGGDDIGWMVGFVERPVLSHVFACLVLAPPVLGDGKGPVFAARRSLPLQLLARAGAIPPTLSEWV